MWHTPGSGDVPAYSQCPSDTLQPHNRPSGQAAEGQMLRCQYEGWLKRSEITNMPRVGMRFKDTG